MCQGLSLTRLEAWMMGLPDYRISTGERKRGTSAELLTKDIVRGLDISRVVVKKNRDVK